MTRYRRQVARALRERDVEAAKRPSRRLHVGDRVPADARPGEVFEIADRAEDGTDVVTLRAVWTVDRQLRVLEVSS